MEGVRGDEGKAKGREEGRRGEEGKGKEKKEERRDVPSSAPRASRARVPRRLVSAPLSEEPRAAGAWPCA